MKHLNQDRKVMDKIIISFLIGIQGGVVLLAILLTLFNKQ